MSAEDGATSPAGADGDRQEPGNSSQKGARPGAGLLLIPSSKLVQLGMDDEAPNDL